MLKLRVKSPFEETVLEEASKTSPDFELPEEVVDEISREKRKWFMERIILSIILAIVGVIPTIIGIKDPWNFHEFRFVFLPFLRGNDYILMGGLVMFGLAIFCLIDCLLNIFIQINQFLPDKLIRGFYNEILCSTFSPNYAKLFPCLAPQVLVDKCKTVSAFKKHWENLSATLTSYLRNTIQKEATCASCKTVGKGITTKEAWNLSDDIIMDKNIFLICPYCEVYICSKCYISLGANSSKVCHSCHKKYKGDFYIFIVDPEFEFKWLDESVTVSDVKKGSNIYQSLLSIKRATRFKLPWPVSSETKSEYDLGEEGALICEFETQAVRIGEKWYLLSAIPGRLENIQ